MRDIRTKKELKDFPVLEDGQVYIYVMEDEDHKVKIGKTKNINKRYQSLCGSNSRGVPIEKVFVSDATFLYVIENIMHEHFDKYRIPNTEWFKELSFKDAVLKLLSLFSSTDYEICNETRKKIVESKYCKDIIKEKKDDSGK